MAAPARDVVVNPTGTVPFTSSWRPEDVEQLELLLVRLREHRRLWSESPRRPPNRAMLIRLAMRRLFELSDEEIAAELERLKL